MVASFRATVTLWLDQTLQGDIYIDAQSLSATRLEIPLDPEVVAIALANPLAQSSAVVCFVSVESEFGPVDLVAATTDPLDARILLEGDAEGAVRQLRNGAILLSEPLAARLGSVSLDSTLPLLTPKGWVEFPVAGIYTDYASTSGKIRMDINVFQTLWQDNTLNGVSLTLLPSADVDTVAAGLRRQISGYERIQVNPSGAIRDAAIKIFDRTFAITTAMQLATTLVGFIGVLSSLLALQLEKAREMSILGALGSTLYEMRRLTFLETGLLGASAGILALSTGYILAWILIFIINQRSFGWTLQMQIEPVPFAQAFVLAVSAALLAAIYPAWRLSRMQTAEALRRE